MFSENKSLVYYVFTRLPGKLRHINSTDVIQEGFVGLLEAIKSYKVEVGTKFSTWGYRIIHQYMMDYIHQKVLVVRPPNQSNHGWDVWVDLRDRIQHLHGGDVLDPRWDREAELIRVDRLAGAIENVLRGIHGRDGCVARLYYIEGKTGAEIAESLGCSKQRVYQLLSRVMEKIRPVLRNLK